MGKSKLVSFTQISPNRNSPRNHKIDTISIHCAVHPYAVNDKVYEALICLLVDICQRNAIKCMMKREG